MWLWLIFSQSAIGCQNNFKIFIIKMSKLNGWQRFYSKSKEKYFYFHKERNIKQWNAPEEILGKRSREEMELRSSIVRAMKVGGTEIQKYSKPKVFKPWEHQIDAIYQILQSLQQEKKRNYLIQHSTGTGKSVTLACLVYQLIEQTELYSTVIVLVDRIQLDEQLGDTVQTFLQRNGCHELIHRSTSVEHLAQILSTAQEKKVILTTVQKFSMLMEDPVRRARLLQHFEKLELNQGCAIVADEAHRSHGHEKRSEMDKFIENLGVNDQHLTYIGFSATPANDSTKLFSSAFHIYPMDQAIRNGHVMNVLENYKSIRLDVETTIPSNIQRDLQTRHSLRAAMDYASALERILRCKMDLILEDFRIRKQKFPDGKCMLIARSRADVVRYFRLLTASQSEWIVFCAFSSRLTAEDDSIVTEKNINPAGITLATCDIIVACDKLDTGYNDPSLMALYLDRHVHGSKTIQLFSRLNRRMDGKQAVHVVDFANHPFQIAHDFSQYWSKRGILRRFSNRKLNLEFVQRQKIVVAASILLESLPEMQKGSESEIQAKLACLERDRYKQIYNAVRMYRVALNATSQNHILIDKE